MRLLEFYIHCEGLNVVRLIVFKQMNALAIEQDVSNLKQECEEKDATIRELSEFLHSSEVAGSKVNLPTLFCLGISVEQ